jgi:hypothetical protein
MMLGDPVIYANGWKVSGLRALRRDKIGFVSFNRDTHGISRVHAWPGECRAAVSTSGRIKVTRAPPSVEHPNSS